MGSPLFGGYIPVETWSDCLWCHGSYIGWYKDPEELNSCHTVARQYSVYPLSWLWYSTLKSAKGLSSSGCSICVQCGGKQHTSTFLAFMYSMKPRLKWALCISSRTITLASPTRIFFSIGYLTKCSPYSWNNLPLMYLLWLALTI